MNKNRKIGIGIANRKSKVGPMIVSMAVVGNNFFRNNRMIVSDSLLDKLDYVYNYKIQPWHLNYEGSKYHTGKAIARALNTYPKFWKYPIYMYFPHKLLIKRFLPNRLKKKEELNMDSWHYLATKSKPAKLAENIAKYFWKKELEDIKLIHNIKGEFDEDEFIDKHPDSPYIRDNGI